jgi:hypothetical protein
MTRIWCPELRIHFARDLVGDDAAFERARERHPVLAAFPTLIHATSAAARTRVQDLRDGVVGAIVAEYQATRSPVWSAAAILAMAPCLASIVRAVSRNGERNDARSSVVLAFLEAMSRTRAARRIAFRLYCETSRRVRRARRVQDEEARRTVYDVERLTWGTDVDGSIDLARLARTIRDLPPAPDEGPAAYLDRVWPLRSRVARTERRHRLRHWRRAAITKLHARLHALSSSEKEKAR